MSPEPPRPEDPAPCAICLSPWPKHQENCLVGQNETLKAERDAERARGDRLAEAERERERLISIATGDIHQSRACVSPDACSCAETFAAETWGADPFDTADHYRALAADPEGGPTDG